MNKYTKVIVLFCIFGFRFSAEESRLEFERRVFHSDNRAQEFVNFALPEKLRKSIKPQGEFMEGKVRITLPGRRRKIRARLRFSPNFVLTYTVDGWRWGHLPEGSKIKGFVWSGQALKFVPKKVKSSKKTVAIQDQKESPLETKAERDCCPHGVTESVIDPSYAPKFDDYQRELEEDREAHERLKSRLNLRENVINQRLLDVGLF